MLQLKKENLVLLPGFDGTGRLFHPFLSVLTCEFESFVVPYPPDKPLSYEALFPSIREVMPWNQPYTLVAESFAGPLALRFAATQPADVKAIVLCASFIRNPLPLMLSWVGSLVNESRFQQPPSAAILKKFLVGDDCPEPILAALLDAVALVSPEVMAHRVRLALDTDATEALRYVQKPILYLHGTQDSLVGQRGLDAIRAVKPSVALAAIDGPHLLLQRRPRECFTAVRQFLAAA